MNKYPILYINLDKSLDRKEFIENQFKKYNINGVRISAISYETILNLDYGTVQNIKYKIKSKNPPNNRQLACILSHIKCLLEFEKMDDNNIIIIMEDDISLELINKWNTTIENIINQAPKIWECIKIDNCNPKLVKSNIKKYQQGINYTSNLKRGSLNLFHILRNYSAGFYIINKQFLKSFYDKYFNNNCFNLFSETESLVSETLLFSIKNCYDYTQPLVFSHGFQRNITEDHNKNNSLNKWEQISKNLILKYYL